MAIGNVLIYLGTLLALGAVAAGLFRRENLQRGFLAAALLVVAGAMALLLGALVRTDFRLEYVAGHTSLSLPLAYRIAALWAGQEGTVLLWTFLLLCLAWILADGAKSDRGTVTIVTSLAGGFCFLLWLKSPFAPVTNGVPADGMGLNPLLQNPWMVVHPPVLFIGYALLAVPFAMAVAAFYRGEVDGWIAPARPWLIAGWVALGAGMMLGGYWAYITLGWGGWWAWDPVENSSLVPWLFATALLHGMILQRRHQAFRLANYTLATVVWATIIYGSYLTRSGVLGDFSVHSFQAVGQSYNALWLVLLATPIAAAAGVYLSRRRGLTRGEVPAASSWMAQAVWLLMAMGGFVWVGMSAPLLTQLLLPEPTAVQQNFYNQTQSLLFLGAGLLLLAVLPPRSTGQKVGVITGAVAAAAAAFALLPADGAASTRYGLLLLCAASGAMAVTGGIKAAASWPARRVGSGAGLAHAGMALVAIGAVLSGPGERTGTVSLAAGETKAVEVVGVEVTWHGESETPDHKTALALSLGENAPRRMATVQDTNNGLMRTPAVFSALAGDIYVEPEDRPSAGGAGGGGEELILSKQETGEVGGLKITFDSFDMGSHGSSGAMSVGAKLEVDAGEGPVEVIPQYVLGADGTQSPPETVGGQEIRLLKIDAGSGAVLLSVGKPGAAEAAEAVVLRVTRKPFIWLVWLGTVVLLVGGAVALAALKVESPH